jgi:hypothetical protein
MEKITQLVAAFSLASLSWDILILFFLFIVALLYGLTMGKNRIALTILSTYISFSVMTVFPFSVFSGVVDDSRLFLVKSAVFIIFIAISFILLNRSFFGHLFKVSRALSNMSFPKIFLISITQVGLFMSIFFSDILSGSGNNLSGLSRIMFTTQTAQVLWVIAPVLLLGIFKSKKSL